MKSTLKSKIQDLDESNRFDVLLLHPELNLY